MYGKAEVDTEIDRDEDDQDILETSVEIFRFTWDEVVRSYHIWMNYEADGIVRSESDHLDLLRRGEIGPISAKDMKFFYQVLGLEYGDPITFSGYLEGISQFALVKARRKQRSSGLRMFSANEVHELMYIFSSIDEDGNNLLSYQELYRYVSSID